jgi:hypothetical protein
MGPDFGLLDEVLGELLETWEHRYQFRFDRVNREIIFRRGDMFASAVEPVGGPGEGQGLVVVSYEWGPGETEYEFCTPAQAVALIDAVMSREDLSRLPKYGKPPLLVLEFAKGSRGLGLDFYPENADAFAQQLPKAKGTLMDWMERHGDRCKVVLFTVISAAENHAAIEALIHQTCREDVVLSPLLRSLELRVGLFTDGRADAVTEYILV